MAEVAEDDSAGNERMWRRAREMIVEADLDGTIIATSPSWAHIMGWSDAEVRGSKLAALIHEDDLSTSRLRLEELVEGGKSARFSNRLRHKDGSYRSISWTLEADEKYLHAIGVDCSDHDLERTSERAETMPDPQKMAALEQMAGKMAHDFNNLLQGISGAIELIRKLIATGRASDTERFINSAMNSSRRAAELSNRLLLLSRQHPRDPKVVEVNALLAEMEGSLSGALMPSIDLRLVLHQRSWTRCDVEQLKQALLNVMSNARDAMPNGGRVTVETDEVRIDHSGSDASSDVAPGEYVRIAVTDAGSGMSSEVAQTAFDPFFTTKPNGIGVGLGLSMVYGFVRHAGGYVTLESRVGHGTTVRLYLPLHRSDRETHTISS